jgi:hypothetical protein
MKLQSMRASAYSVCDSIIQQIPLKKMPESVVSAMSSLYVPPKERSFTDKVMLDQLQKILSKAAAIIRRVILSELPEQKPRISTLYPPPITVLSCLGIFLLLLEYVTTKASILG